MSIQWLSIFCFWCHFASFILQSSFTLYLLCCCMSEMEFCSANGMTEKFEEEVEFTTDSCLFKTGVEQVYVDVKSRPLYKFEDIYICWDQMVYPWFTCAVFLTHTAKSLRNVWTPRNANKGLEWRRCCFLEAHKQGADTIDSLFRINAALKLVRFWSLVLLFEAFYCWNASNC